jgi:hypothetical protein
VATWTTIAHHVAPVKREAKIMSVARLFVLRDDGGVRAFVRSPLL